MMCAECRKRITPREQFQAVILKDEQGRITAAYHRHHARRARALARTDGAVPGLVYHEDRPSAYDVEHETSDVEDSPPGDQGAPRSPGDQAEALREHQERLAADREQEPTPKRFDDWRDPQTVTLEDLLAEVEKEVEKGDA